MTHVLLVDKDPMALNGLRYALQQEGYYIDSSGDGEDAISMFTAARYDLILLDIDIPGLSGLEVCRRFRETSDVPVIFLTAKCSDMDKVLGFEAGADDYVTKPFNMLELKARIKVHVKRSQRLRLATPRGSQYELAGVFLDTASRAVVVDNMHVFLSDTNFDILALLMSAPGQVFTHAELCAAGRLVPDDVRSLAVHMNKIRDKIKTDTHKPRIISKRGVGYYLQVD